MDTAKRHPSGATFLALNDITLVPYEARLIEPTLLSPQERRWLNAYNAKIREYVGDELKRNAGDMQAFYWMMNKTRHVNEFYTEEDYRRQQMLLLERRNRIAGGASVTGGWMRGVLLVIAAIVYGL